MFDRDLFCMIKNLFSLLSQLFGCSWQDSPMNVVWGINLCLTAIKEDSAGPGKITLTLNETRHPRVSGPRQVNPRVHNGE